MSSTSPHDSNQSTTDFPSDKEGIGNDQLEETLWSATNPTGAPATATSPRKKHKPKQSIYCSLLWRRIFDESPVKLDLGRAKVQVKFDPAIKEWRIVKPEGKQQDGPLHQHYSVLIHFKSYLHFVFIAWIRLYIQINTTPRQMIELCESAGDVSGFKFTFTCNKLLYLLLNAFCPFHFCIQLNHATFTTFFGMRIEDPFFHLVQGADQQHLTLPISHPYHFTDLHPNHFTEALSSILEIPYCIT